MNDGFFYEWSIDPVWVGILVALGLILVFGLWCVWYHRPRHFRKSQIRQLVQQIENIPAQPASFAVLEYHKIFIKALNRLLNQPPENAAQTIKLLSHRLPNPEQIWRIHRLRNRIAHEPQTLVSNTQRELAKKDISRALWSLD